MTTEQIPGQSDYLSSDDELRSLLPGKVLSALGDVLQEPLDPTPALERSRLLPTLTDAAVDALLGVAGPRSPVDARSCSCGTLAARWPVRRPSQEWSARSRRATSSSCSASLPFPSSWSPLLGQLDQAEQAMAPFASDRRMFNFLGHGADPSAAFSKEALARLRAIKAERDPLGVIRSNRPVLHALKAARIPRQRA